MKINKKAMSEVIGVVLIISIVVLAVIGFGSWQNGYLSDVKVGIEEEHKSDFNTGIGEIIGDNIYFQNDGRTKQLTAVQVEENYCDITKELNTGATGINISSCINNLATGIYTVVIITDVKTYSKSVFIEIESGKLKQI